MSTVHKFIGTPTKFDWEGVAIHAYGAEFEGVTRQVPIGEPEGSDNFIIRYFRLEPGTHSNLERHPHEHGVLIVHGKARFQLNDQFYDVQAFDSIYITGNDLHQFVQQGDEPFGFVCVIKAKK
jgi:quercetin dioxygenase-like cupin family protein